MRWLVITSVILLSGCAAPAPDEVLEQQSPEATWTSFQEPFLVQVPMGAERPVAAYLIHVPPDVETVMKTYADGSTSQAVRLILYPHNITQEPTSWFAAFFEVGDEARLIGARLEYDTTVEIGPSANQRWTSTAIQDVPLKRQPEAGSRLGILVGADGPPGDFTLGIMGMAEFLPSVPEAHQAMRHAPRMPMHADATGWAMEELVDVYGHAFVNLVGEGVRSYTDGLEYIENTVPRETDPGVLVTSIVKDRFDADASWSSVWASLSPAPTQTGTWQMDGHVQDQELAYRHILSPGLAKVPGVQDILPWWGVQLRLVNEGSGDVALSFEQNVAGPQISGGLALGYSAFHIGGTLEDLLGAPSEQVFDLHDPLGAPLPGQRALYGDLPNR